MNDQRRLARLALELDDVGALEKIMAKVSGNAKPDQFWSLCRGWIALRRNRIEDALAAWEGVLWEGFSQDSGGLLPSTGWRQYPLAACQALFDAEGDWLPATVRDALTWLLHASGYKTAGTKTLAAVVERLETSLRSEPTGIAGQQEASPLAVVYPSFALARLRHYPQGDTRLYLQALPNSILPQVETALHAERHEWQAALYSLGPSAPAHLRRQLVSRAVEQAHRQQQWEQLGIALARWDEDDLPETQRYVRTAAGFGSCRNSCRSEIWMPWPKS